MIIKRFLHLASKTYLGLYMPNSPYHYSNTSNSLTGIPPNSSNQFNSNWSFNPDNSTNGTSISTASWKIGDAQLYFTAYNKHTTILGFEMEIAARPPSQDPYTNFYFKPNGIIEGIQYFQICVSYENIEYFIYMKQLKNDKYNIRLTQNLSIEENITDTLFALEDRA